MKIRKIVGYLLYHGIGKHLPASYAPVKIGQKAFRACCARLMLDKCGKGVNIERGAIFSMQSSIGDYSGIGVGANLGRCIIGNDVLMGPYCTIYTRNHKFDDPTTPIRLQGNQEEQPVIIGDDVWIGGHVIILPGVKIGSHSIIGAGSVVTRDVPEWAIVAGNPAVLKKTRCDSPQTCSAAGDAPQKHSTDG